MTDGSGSFIGRLEELAGHHPEDCAEQAWPISQQACRCRSCVEKGKHWFFLGEVASVCALGWGIQEGLGTVRSLGPQQVLDNQGSHTGM